MTSILNIPANWTISEEYAYQAAHTEWVVRCEGKFKISCDDKAFAEEFARRMYAREQM